MKALKTKVILSAFVLLFAVVATIGSTFAWFTVSNQVSVDQFQLDVKTVDSLLIRVYDGETDTTSHPNLLDANTYSTNLTTALIQQKATYTDFLTWKLTPVTAVQLTGTHPTLTLDTPALNPFALKVLNIDSPIRETSAAVKNDPTNGHYLELKFWILSQGSAAVEVVLQNLNITVSGLATPNPVPAQNNVVKAVRLGVQADGGLARVYGINTDNPYNFQFTSGMRGYQATAGFNSILPADQTTLIGLHALFHDEANVAVANISADSLAGSTLIFEPVQNTPKLVTVVVYLEGWDYYAANAIIAAKFNIGFQFALRPKA